MKRLNINFAESSSRPRSLSFWSLVLMRALFFVAFIFVMLSGLIEDQWFCPFRCYRDEYIHIGFGPQRLRCNIKHSGHLDGTVMCMENWPTQALSGTVDWGIYHDFFYEKWHHPL